MPSFENFTKVFSIMLYFIAIAVSLIKITLEANPSGKCIGDWKILNQNCYKYFVLNAGTVSWDSAEANCTDFGANLASIHSLAEEV